MLKLLRVSFCLRYKNGSSTETAHDGASCHGYRSISGLLGANDS